MKFECQESCGGKCCKPGWSGSHFIFLTDADIVRIEQFTGLHRNQFSKVGEFEWTRFATEKVTARFMGQCPFLQDGSCDIYEARPTQCRTFPYWPENMSDEKWKALSAECPGIGKGPLDQDPLEVQLKLAEQRRADGKYGETKV